MLSTHQALDSRQRAGKGLCPKPCTAQQPRRATGKVSSPLQAHPKVGRGVAGWGPSALLTSCRPLMRAHLIGGGSTALQLHPLQIAAGSQTVPNLMPRIDTPSAASSFPAHQHLPHSSLIPFGRGGGEASLLVGTEGASAASAAGILMPAQSNESEIAQFKPPDLISPFLSMAIQIKLPSFHPKTR